VRLTAELSEQGKVEFRSLPALFEIYQPSRVNWSGPEPASIIMAPTRGTTPSVKQLLTQRNPNPIYAPSAERLSKVFERSFDGAKRKGAERGWLVLSTSTLLGCNSPSSIGHLYRYATASANGGSTSASLKDRLAKAACMRESALKGSIFVGVAMTINAMAALREALEPDVKAELRTTPLPTRQLNVGTVATISERGERLWRSIYEPHADKLINKLGIYHPDFPLFILGAYGSVLTPQGLDDPGDLSRTESSLVGIATLRAIGGVGPQLVSHVFGLMKAGDSPQNDSERWLSTQEGVEWALGTIDELCDVVYESGSEPVKSKL